jgi:hypothetical protein
MASWGVIHHRRFGDMSARNVIKVKPGEFESLGKKLERLFANLSPGEAEVFSFLMEAVAIGAGQAPPPAWITPHFRYKPRGAKALVVGGSDGLTILINAHGKITIVPPIGPLPMDRHTDVLGAIPIQG